ncbi:MAG: lectin like domain-containing protein, partial [Agathobacter sp.]|nr:lectin like domain-containing protein [Agathobacter sp.]
HDVVIVGWDDNAYGPNWPSKGGWLVRNSWSTNQSSSSEYTYFYMSYYDKSLASTAYLADFEAYSSADNIYQHDGVNTFASIYVDGAANVYKANSYMDKASEKLDSVMLTFTRDENINYKIEVYTGLTSSDPTSGYLNEQATTTGWTTSKGIYTVQLNSPVYLSPGEKYSIVVTSLNGSHYFNIETSSEVTYNQDGYTNAWFTTQAYADQGESFYYNYGTWNDVIYYGYGYGNMCIKALTVDDATAKYTVNYVMDGGINNPANPVYFLSTQSGSADLQNPSRSGYHFLGWYTDPSYTNKVTSVNYNNKYNQTLYARWCADSNPHNTQVFSYATMDTDGSYQTSCSGCGTVISSGTSFMASSVKLNYNRLSYTGKNISPVPVITTSNGEVLTEGTDYTYKYNKSTRKNIGRYSVTVNFMGRYAGSKKIWFTVVPKAPGSASAKLHGYNDITVTWSKATGASGYYVYYKKASASTYKNYKRTTKRTLKFNNLSGNVKYNFKIVPYYKNGKTYYKSTKAKIVSSTTLMKLKQPNIYKVYNGRVSLDWASISGASGYQVWWSKSKSGKYSKLCDYSNKYTGVSFSVGKNQKYWYKTRAYKKVGKSKIYGPWSDPKAFTLR